MQQGVRECVLLHTSYETRNLDQDASSGASACGGSGSPLPPGRPAEGAVALSSVTCSVTCTISPTFRLGQLMLLIPINIHGR